MMTLNIQFNQRHWIGLATTLGVLVLITFGYISHAWYQDWKLAHLTVGAAVKIDTDKTANMIAGIPDQHLFGLAPIGEMPITNLQLRVTGIVRAANAHGENVSKAYISISGAPSKIYQVGDSLPDGVKLYDINTDTVILENSGKLEKLPLPRHKLEFKPRDKEGN